MKIAVINGSPRGKYSITLQTVRYLEREFSSVEFVVLNVGQTIKALEKDFSKAREVLSACDGILFSYPVYTFIAPSQLHRFIELLKEDGVVVSGKFATQITTSKHFYDVTAHKYIEENCADLGLKYIKGLSADMEDLLTEQGRTDAKKFFERVLWSVQEGLFEKPCVAEYTHFPVEASVPVSSVSEKKEKTIVIVTDCVDENSNLYKMIERFRAVLPYQTKVANIAEYPIKAGCLGCFNCAVSAKCVHKDNFEEFLRNEIQTADATVYAFTVKDHSMGARFKMYDDRNFCNGHRTVTVGMPVGYLASGAYSKENNLKMIVEGRAETGGNFLCGVATDEIDTDIQIDAMAKTLVFALESRHVAPKNFYGVGGMKIFRDLIYEMRGMMRADHKFYKKNGYYDFPQKKKLNSMKMYLVGALMSSEPVRKKMGNKMNEGMLMPYEKLFKKLEKEKQKKN